MFLQIGGEGTANPIWMVTGSWTKYAQQYNALMFQVEHRYYGKSHPVRYILLYKDSFTYQSLSANF